MRTPDARRARWSLAAGLLVLSPMCAEYLAGYDDSTGDPFVLVVSLMIFSPLYGAPALLIRETARRLGMRWPEILALAAAFGVLQAAVVDQSLFSEGYRDIPYWEEMIRPTYVEPLGLAAHTALAFVGGHAIWSFGAPIALIEALAPRLPESWPRTPSLSRTPWLRTPGLAVTAALYLAAASLVLRDHLRTEPDHASAAQIGGALAVAALLALLAFLPALRRRRCVPPGPAALPEPPGLPDPAVPPDRPVLPDPAVRPGPAAASRRPPRPIAVAAAGLVAGLGFDLLPSTWAGVAAAVALLTLTAAVAGRLARSPEWTGRHVAALAAGALTARTVVGFFVVPLGDVAPVAKYAHNVAFLTGAVLLGVLAMRRRGTTGPGG
ncbi:hypothetical protein F5972_16390 [Microbispora cellulosiformans]|uniref:DUF998 domain-containing protein n=1 Tax=Microbispora cellulosiformans TaxID=2614688 RepID=A0A5J5K5R2_9ACTN|nr:hypothetical protein [Microbispora cellulosiformans]KAA9378430.1 hypothetical protein F5972_16390 [Microbispora cellulosiformans]